MNFIGHDSSGTFSNDTKLTGTVIGEFQYRLRVTVARITVTLDIQDSMAGSMNCRLCMGRYCLWAM